jgi:hypothetical protein
MLISKVKMFSEKTNILRRVFIKRNAQASLLNPGLPGIHKDDHEWSSGLISSLSERSPGLQ